jgi:YfiH family protein
VGIAHAGWRGLSNGILESLLTTLPLAPAQLFAWLGPAISVNAYEVGDEVRQCFLKTQGNAALHYFNPSARTTGHWMADLSGLATLILHRAGIDTITASRSCTVAQPQDFFSHRRDGPATGRMATVVWRA